MQDDGTDLVYFASDHLSSTAIVMDASGTLLSEQRYLPFGGVRGDVSTAITETDFGYTGQRNLGGMGLMDYNARFYSPLLGRFVQPDSIVARPGDSQSFNRFSYVGNNPVTYSDPSGNCIPEECPLYKDIIEPQLPPTNNSSPFVEITWNERREKPSDNEIAAIELDARVLAGQLYRAYNRHKRDVCKLETLDNSDCTSLPQLTKEELWDVIFGGPVNFHFETTECSGCYAKRDASTDPNSVFVGSNIPTNYFSTHPGMAIHELFHLFDQNSGQVATLSLYGKESQLNRAQGGWAGGFEEAQFSEADDWSEVVADMAVGWARLGFDTTDPRGVGNDRQNYMDANVPLWIEAMLESQGLIQ